ncbi:MAG TPA: HipA N-terminal domain-containing protein, partial [bacterium]|nr:HipA N-terminal domain-containing protein [bacterium]
MSLKIDKITAIDVYAEFGKSRILVGRLHKIKDKFQFTYDRKYLKSEKKLSLGPEFPMTKIRFFSDSLFNSFKDRIPSKENPAYSEYCEKFGVSSDENNELILLATIGSRGPSSFVFEPVFDSEFTAVDLAAFRKKLKLSIRDFAILFDFSYATLNKIENGKKKKNVSSFEVNDTVFGRCFTLRERKRLLTNCYFFSLYNSTGK